MTGPWEPPRPLPAGEALGDRGDAGPHPLDVITRWVRDYLCRPHPELGRSGAVCPYTRQALEGGRLLGAVWPTRPDGPEQVARVMRRYLSWFVARQDGADDPHRALLVAFPGVDEPDWGTIIEGAQRRLKPSFVRHGLMVGEFHPGPPAAQGIRNPGFRPLRSPLPILAVRPMVRSDLPFLDQAPWSLDAWTARFG
ncbi:DUF6875 domain-containing protein [Actinomadura oligospora]|uniref:DUF6875 domain-containing protein n=1 Tax=Actinomadura oligospora TaxID=111804 RepID=UPI0004B3FBA4|nr:hypothetical protein [Actinomadura oligospora]